VPPHEVPLENVWAIILNPHDQTTETEHTHRQCFTDSKCLSLRKTLVFMIARTDMPRHANVLLENVRAITLNALDQNPFGTGMCITLGG
jgi:hypothetical protein